MQLSPFPLQGVNGRRTACGDEADYEGMHAPRLTSSGANTKRPTAVDGGRPGIGC